MPSTSVFHGRPVETYLTIALASGTTLLRTDQAMASTLEFTGGGTSTTVQIPVTSEDKGLRWNIYPNMSGANTFILGNAGSAQTVTLPTGVMSYVLWTGSAWILLDGSAAGSVADAALNGVPSDGITDASDALANLISGAVSVRLAQGATYLVSRPLTLLSRQTLYGNGATLSRANQVSATTTTTITAGVTRTLTVADASPFRVGMSINVLNGTSYDQSNRVISGVAGNAITVSTAWNLTGGGASGSASGTTTVYSSWNVLTTATGARVYDLWIEGNKANFTFYRWEATKEILIVGDDVIVSGCHSQNGPGEGIYVNGDYARVRDNTVTTLNGNAVHLSGCAHPLIAGNRFLSANLDHAVGHANGIVIWSNTISDATCIGNYLDTTDLSGFGSIDSAGNSDITITGNTIRNCTVSPFDMNGSEPGAVKVLFANNRCYASGTVRILDTQSAETTPDAKVTILGNYFSQTLLDIRRSQNVLVADNIFDYTIGSSSIILCYITNAQWVTVRGNQFIGGAYGVYLDGGNGSIQTQDILVEGNSCRMQYTDGIRQQVGVLTNVRIANNIVNADTNSDHTNYIAILVKDGAHCFGNSVQFTFGAGGIRCSGNNGIIEHNVVRNGAGYSIRADGSSTGVILRDNLVTTAVSDLGDGLHTSGNITIA